MAEQNCSLPNPITPVIIVPELAQSEADLSSPVSSSCERMIEKNALTKQDGITNNTHESNMKGNELKTSDNSNGVSEKHEKRVIAKPSLFLRPSTLISEAKTLSTSEIPNIKCPLKSPKLNLTPSKFGNAEGSSKSPFMQPKSPFTNSVCFDDEKPEWLSKNNTNDSEVDSSKPSIGSTSFSNTSVCSVPTNSSLSVQNFVFGQNLHERVTDSFKPGNENDGKPQSASTSNGTSDLLFTSVLSTKEVNNKESNDSASNSKETSSLLEDAARYEEARANKRKYEEVHVPTGEEGEENILQINVKLFAFDNGLWAERGRGTLRLNDKTSEEPSSSRIVIRALGSLRLALNTAIWSGMAPSRASERSVRLTALDPVNGQVKIFLVQASPKDITTLYRCLELRMKRCQDRDVESNEAPTKKLAAEVEQGDTQRDEVEGQAGVET